MPWPWGYQSAPVPDAALLSAAGTRLAQLAGYASNQTYFAVGYTTGDALDWSYGTLGSLGLGLELDQGYAPDIGTVQSIWQKNRTDLYDAARWAMNPVRAQRLPPACLAEASLRRRRGSSALLGDGLTGES